MVPRETYHHGDLRAALVAEGLHQLERSGESALSLRALAKAAGVSPNAPYRHFADKDELMGALAAEGFEQFADVIAGAGAPTDAALDVLKAQGLAYLNFATSRPALYRLMFSPLGYSLHSQACQNHSERAFGTLVAAVARAQAEGWKTGQDFMSLVLGFWAALHGWVGLVGERLLPPEVTVPEAKTWLDALLWDGTR
jgi:AcrR family transcriptional regulator